MKILKAVLSKGTPGIKDALWIKPVEGGVALYVQNGGWKPLKVVDDKSTVSTGDDKPKAIITVTNIGKLSNKQCEALNVGDQVIKKTSGQKHLYTVTYKEEKQGLCLTYMDAENVETVPYDWNSETSKWEVGEITYGAIPART